MKKENWRTLLGGLLLFGFGYWDTEWRLFWFLAGGVMVCWAFVTTTGNMMRRN